MFACLPVCIGDDNAALLLSPPGSCKINQKTLQTEQTTTLLHALKCEFSIMYIQVYIANLSVYIDSYILLLLHLVIS